MRKHQVLNPGDEVRLTELRVGQRFRWTATGDVVEVTQRYEGWIGLDHQPLFQIKNDLKVILA